MFVVLAAHAQIQDPVKFKTELKTLSDTEGEIIFTGTIDRGWHVYSTDLGDGGPISATFNVDKMTGAELVGKLKPGVNVAESVCRRDLAEGVGVIHHWREEVHRLHQRDVVGDAVDGRIVPAVVAHEKAFL